MFFSNNRTLSSFLLPVSPFPFSHFFCFCFSFSFFLFDSDWLLTFARITVSFAFLRNCKKEKNKQKKFSLRFVLFIYCIFAGDFFHAFVKLFWVCMFVCLLEKFFHNFSFLTCCALLPATLSLQEKETEHIVQWLFKVSCKIVERHLKLKIKVRIHQMIF